MKSHQETFNDVVRGLAKQNFRRAVKRQIDHGVLCAYKNWRGDRCGVGVLLPDDAPDAVWEFAGYVDALQDEFPNFSIWGEHDIYRLGRLQVVHDTSATPDDMRANLRAYAKEHGLALPKELGGAE